MQLFENAPLWSQSSIEIIANTRSSLGVSETYLEKIANSEWGYVALAAACYKLATPARYTVTVGATTFAIKYLNVRLTELV